MRERANEFFDYEQFVKRIDLGDLGMNVKLECCTPMYALHALHQKSIDETVLAKCTQFLKVYTESRVLVIDLSQENLPVIKEVSELK